MINIGWGLAFFFSQIWAIVNLVLPWTAVFALVGFLLFLVLKY